MTYQKFHDKFYSDILPNKHSDIRNGQALMIYLSEVWFAEYKRMVSKFSENVDCFNNDNLIPTTFAHLKNNWHHFPNDIKKLFYTTHKQKDYYYVINIYYVNNNDIVILFNMIVDSEIENSIREKLISLNFDKNICLVTL